MGLVVGMGQFPRGRVPSAEIGLTGQAQFGEESQSSLDRGSVNSGVWLLGVFGDSCGCKVASATANALRTGRRWLVSR